RPGAIFNDHRLTELGRELIADHTRHNVDDAPGGKGDDRPDRSGRPSLCPRFSTREGDAKNRQQHEANPRHAVLPRIEAGIAWEICQEAAIPVLPILRIAHHGTAVDRCTAGFRPSLCPLWVISYEGIEVLRPCTSASPESAQRADRLSRSALRQQRL